MCKYIQKLVFQCIFVVSVLLLGLPCFANAESQDSLALPKVFVIGEHEEEYGLLYETYQEILLSVCNDDMYLAFDKWMDMLLRMEDYAAQIDFDLKGVKVWLKVFWARDGNIDHLAYHLKPTSLNIDKAELSAFFRSFAKQYQMSVEADAKFSHHGSAQFPTSTMPGVARR